ncbi:MAG: hypothetical protein H6704_08235 [Myxococcales bacterium]|nr:hypothetical protein [Myxococcales bacterium]
MAARPWALDEGRWLAVGALAAGWAWGVVSRPAVVGGGAWVGLALGFGALVVLGDALGRRIGPRPGWATTTAAIGLGAWGIRDVVGLYWTGSAG